MENKLEQLLNSLIEKGWCPIWKEYTWPHKPFISSYKDRVHWKQFYYNEWWDWDYRLQKVFTLRELTSINSGLWQFVCENGMIKWMLVDIDGSAYKYYITESSLKDESELEDFILDNIKIDVESK